MGYKLVEHRSGGAVELIGSPTAFSTRQRPPATGRAAVDTDMAAVLARAFELVNEQYSMKIDAFGDKTKLGTRAVSRTSKSRSESDEPKIIHVRPGTNPLAPPARTAERCRGKFRAACMSDRQYFSASPRKDGGLV